MDQHTCKTCKEVKSTSEFGKNSRLKNGLFKSCKVCVNQKNQNYVQANPDKYLKIKQRWAKNNKELNKKQKADWVQRNVKTVREKSRLYKNLKYKTDVLFKLKTNIRNRVNEVFKRKASQRTTSLLGCEIEEYKIYIEKKFQPGMNWENHTNNGWHIDHIKPLASFDLSQESEVQKAFHYTNTQPLWATENLRKNAKLDWAKDEVTSA